MHISQVIYAIFGILISIHIQTVRCSGAAITGNTHTDLNHLAVNKAHKIKDVLKLRELIKSLINQHDYDGIQAVEQPRPFKLDQTEEAESVAADTRQDAPAHVASTDENRDELDDETESESESPIALTNSEEELLRENDSELEESKRSTAYLRFGKRNPAYLRFGRGQAYLRFGKRQPASHLRFGKRNPAYLRFGRSVDNVEHN